MKKFRWAYIGCGAIAVTTAKEISKTSDNEVYAVWNRSKQRAKEFAKKFKCKVYENVEDMLKDPNVDGVYIALTHDKHFEYMKKCIKYHKPVLCEKPFTINAKEAKKIFKYAEKEKVYVSEAMWTWHNKTALKVKSWLKDKKIGSIIEVNCEYRVPIAKYIKTTRLMDYHRAGGALLDIGVYPLRYSLELFGRSNKIECTGRFSNNVDLGEVVIFYYDDFIIYHDIAMDVNTSEYYSIKGEKGEINIPFFHCAKKAFLRGEHKEKFVIEDNLYAKQFSNVANEIRKGLTTSKFIRPEMTIACMEIMDECRKKMNFLYPSEIKK